MQWRKKGLIFCCEGQHDWMVSHASLPVTFHLKDDLYRIYFASRDKNNRSHIGYIELELTNPKKILYLSDKPVLQPGPLGYFDDHGVYASSIVQFKNQLYLYYIGWNPGIKEPLFYANIGLAISDDCGRTFKKFSPAPIMSRSEYDPCLVTSPFVLKEQTCWRMWYISGFRWETVDNKLRSYYHVKYAESIDGINWRRKGVVALDFATKEETNISRFCVLRESTCFKGWFGYNRGKGYRIGYAESEDGINWIRKDDVGGLEVSTSGEDSLACSYPYVIVHKGKKYMFYNGNDFGKKGILLAVSV